MAGAIPVAPSLWYLNYNKDPRLKKSTDWWVENVYGRFMFDCHILCYRPNIVGLDDDIVTAEKALWQKINVNLPQVSSDVILDFLLTWNAKNVLNGLRRIQK